MRQALLVLLYCLLSSLEVLSQTPVVVRGPYLQMAYAIKQNENFTRAFVTIRWRTDLPTLGRVVYAEEFEGLSNGGRIVDETTASTEHKIVLTDLATDRLYNYYIGTAFNNANPTEQTLILEKSVNHVFRTPPAPGSKKKIQMWVLGDFGALPKTDFNNRQDSTIASFQNFMTVNKTGPMDLWLWLGDNAYEQGTEAQYQDHIFDKGRGRYDWIFRQTPFYATPGNHDYYDGALTVPQREVNRFTKNVHYYSVVDNFKNGEGGGEPSGTEAYYSFNYGNIHFISLDTYGYEKSGDTPIKILTTSGEQYKWLKRDLAKTNANPDINWVIVFTHMPPYSGGSHNSDTEDELTATRQNLIPLLDSNKVDLVLSGHSHDYQRSRLMRGHSQTSTSFNLTTHNPSIGSNAQGSGKYDGTANSCFYYKTSAATQNEGIVYVVNGGGGRPNEGTASQLLQNPSLISKIMQSAIFMGGSMHIEVENKRLTAKFIGANKQVLDQFVIYKDLDNFTVPRTDSTTRIATCECTEALNQNTSFTHYTDNNANLLLSIAKHDINIGKVGVPPFEVRLSGAAGRTNIGAFYPDNYVRADRTRSFSSNWRIMNRYWSVKPTTELSGTQQVTIRHYYKQEDLASLFWGASAEDLVYREYLKFYKINSINTAYNLDPKAGKHNTLQGATAYNKDGIWIYDKSLDITPAQASLNHFKNRYIGDFPLHFHYLLSDTHYGEFVVGRLAGGGGIGGQGSGLDPRGSLTLISSGDQWKYLATGIKPVDYTNVSGGVTEVLSWKGSNKIIDYYNTFVNWPQGTASFGYSPNGEDFERWTIPACAAELACYEINANEAHLIPGCATTPCANRWTTYYFRKTFAAPDLSNAIYKSIIINYKRDDGVIIYVNGKELLPRDPNMPTGTITETTFSNGSPEYVWQTVVIPNDGNYFRKEPFNATNTVAVELHQNSLTSSDVQFDMEVVLSQDALTAPTRIAAAETLQTTEPSHILYPNPTDGKVYFSNPLVYETIRMADSRGVVVRYLSAPGSLNELDLSDFPAGVFILSSQDRDKVTHYKIIKK